MTGAASWRHEVGRKAVHVSMMVLPAWIYFAPPPWSARGPVLAFLALLTVDVLRLGSSAVHRWFEARIGAYLRPDEHQGLIRMHYLSGAAAFLGLVMPPAIAALAMADLVFGDAAAALAGRRWGKPRWGRKSLEGSAACLVICALAGWAILPGNPAAILVSAVIATVIEALPMPVDDNLAVPLATAAALWWLV